MIVIQCDQAKLRDMNQSRASAPSVAALANVESVSLNLGLISKNNLVDLSTVLSCHLLKTVSAGACYRAAVAAQAAGAAATAV